MCEERNRDITGLYKTRVVVINTLSCTRNTHYITSTTAYIFGAFPYEYNKPQKRNAYIFTKIMALWNKLPNRNFIKFLEAEANHYLNV